MKISLIGNCQTIVLAWYLQQLEDNLDIVRIKMEGDLGDKIENNFFSLNSLSKENQIQKDASIIKVIKQPELGEIRLRESNVVIYQHLSKKASKRFHSKRLQRLARESQLISISSMHYDPLDPSQTYLNKMITKALRQKIDVPAHKIIEKHGKKITMASVMWPQAFYFLELTREICQKIGLNYYSDTKYSELLELGYPFG